MRPGNEQEDSRQAADRSPKAQEEDDFPFGKLVDQVHLD